MEKKIAWVIFGASSPIAKSLVEKLKENEDYKIFAVSRNSDYDFKKFKESIKDLEGFEIYSVLFNGKIFFKKFEDISPKDLQDIEEANLDSTIFYLQAILKNNLNTKKVMIIGSRAGQITGHHKYFSLYAATKTACLGLLRSLSAEFPNTMFTYYICPATDTDIFKNGAVDQELLLEVKSKENTVKKTTKEIAVFIKDTLENQKENFKDLII